MKVVLFCGGLGMRLREFSESIPKPMVPIGYRPILWHVMRYYAHYGHNEFILCLGYKADMIKNYFLHYDEYLSNDFTLSEGGKHIELMNSDMQDWKITFVDTGLTANIGQRLRAVQKHLQGETTFLANYADGLTDLPLPKLIDSFHDHNKIASFVCVQPTQNFHTVVAREDGTVKAIEAIKHSGLAINGGFFVFNSAIFDYMRPGEELVEQPFQRLIAREELMAYRYDGFWACMDTFKDKQMFDDLYASGDVPWEVWHRPERELAFESPTMRHGIGAMASL